MRYYLYDNNCDFSAACERECVAAGLLPADEPHLASVAIAPLLRRRLQPSEWSAPVLGTLIFHPSALPYRRGPDAVRNAIAAGERVSAATWFWCTAGFDEGPVCEQEVVVLMPGESAGRAYHTRFVPAGIRALRRSLAGIAAGEPRRVPQDAGLATYDAAVPVAVLDG